MHIRVPTSTSTSSSRVSKHVQEKSKSPESRSLEKCIMTREGRDPVDGLTVSRIRLRRYVVRLCLSQKPTGCSVFEERAGLAGGGGSSRGPRAVTD